MSKHKGNDHYNSPYDMITRHVASNVAKVPRKKILVTIITDQFRLVGNIHIDPAQRITDFLSEEVTGISDRFIPITEVKAYPIKGEELLFERPFLAVRLKTINILDPLEEKIASAPTS